MDVFLDLFEVMCTPWNCRGCEAPRERIHARGGSTQPLRSGGSAASGGIPSPTARRARPSARPQSCERGYSEASSWLALLTRGWLAQLLGQLALLAVEL